MDSYLCDYQIENTSSCPCCRLRRARTLSKQSETDSHTFALGLNQQSYSTPEPRHIHVPSYSFTDETNRRIRTESTSTILLPTLLERYERTLRERQRAIAIVKDELIDIGDVLTYYREKMQDPIKTQSDRVIIF